MKKNFILVLILILHISSFSIGKLNLFDENSNNRLNNNHQHDIYIEEGNEDIGFVDYLALSALRYTLLSPFSLPYLLLESERVYYSKEDEKLLLKELELNYQFKTEEVSALSVKTMLTFYRINFEYEYGNYFENLKDDFYELREYHDIFLSHTFAKNDNLEFRTGIGYNKLIGNRFYDGVLMIYRIDFKGNNMSVGLDLDLILYSKINNIYKTNFELGYLINKVNIGFGYKNLGSKNSTIGGFSSFVRYNF